MQTSYGSKFFFLFYILFVVVFDFLIIYLIFFREHLDFWHQLGHSRSSRRHWGVRRAPKTVLFKELKLTSKGEYDSVVDNFETELKYNANSDGLASGSQKLSRCKQLLQFDKSHRPAFYGYWPKKRWIIYAYCYFL